MHWNGDRSFLILTNLEVNMAKAPKDMKSLLQPPLDAVIASTKKLPEKTASSPLCISGR